MALWRKEVNHPFEQSSRTLSRKIDGETVRDGNRSLGRQRRRVRGPDHLVHGRPRRQTRRPWLIKCAHDTEPSVIRRDLARRRLDEEPTPRKETVFNIAIVVQRAHVWQLQRQRQDTGNQTAAAPMFASWGKLACVPCSS